VTVALLCPNLMCRKPLTVADRMRGKQVRCPFCQQKLIVPTSKPTPRPKATQP